MDEQLQWRVGVTLKDTLTGHTAITAMCPSAYGTEGLILAGVTTANHY